MPLQIAKVAKKIERINSGDKFTNFTSTKAKFKPTITKSNVSGLCQNNLNICGKVAPLNETESTNKKRSKFW
jgi:hypothetical protein